MRKVLESVTSDTVRHSTDSRGFFTTGYDPHKISSSVYVCGEIFRKPGYHCSSDQNYLKDLFSDVNLMAPPLTASLCLMSTAFPTFYDKVNLHNEANVREKLQTAPEMWSLENELAICRRVLQTSGHFDAVEQAIAITTAAAAFQSSNPKVLALTTVHATATSLNLKPEIAQNILSLVNQALSIGPIEDLVKDDELRVVRGHKGCTTVNLLPDQLIVAKSSVKVKAPQNRKCPTKKGAVLNKSALDRIGTIKDLEKRKVLRDGRKKGNKKRGLFKIQSQ